MKKFLLLLPIVALTTVACAQEYAEYDSIFPDCERIETSTEHLVYKCPADLESIQNLKTIEPNGMFMTGGELNLAELYADTEHTYVEIALNDAGFCEQDFTIRTMVSEPTPESFWAVVGCK